MPLGSRFLPCRGLVITGDNLSALSRDAITQAHAHGDAFTCHGCWLSQGDSAVPNSISHQHRNACPDLPETTWFRLCPGILWFVGEFEGEFEGEFIE